jgi:hypothetical protein
MSDTETKVVIEEGVVSIITVGEQGPPGPVGAQGNPGPAGQGMPPGGSVGELLRKVNNNDYGTAWDTIDESDVAGLTSDLAAKEPAVTPGTSTSTTGAISRGKLSTRRLSASRTSTTPQMPISLSLPPRRLHSMASRPPIAI